MGIYRREVYRSTRLKVDFEMDRAGIRKIAVGKELRLACTAIVAAALPYAESIAPRGNTGDYSKAFRLDTAHIWIAGMRRIAARLTNADPAAAAIEFGTDTTPAHFTLRKTLAHIQHRVGGGGVRADAMQRPGDDDGG